MIGSAYQQGIYVRVTSPEGQTLFTQKGTLKGYTSDCVSISKKDHVRICDHQGNTISTYRCKEVLPEVTSTIAWNKWTILLYLLLGWLIKIGAAYRLYQFLGRGNAIGSDGGDLNWKDIGIWMISVLFWVACFAVTKTDNNIFNKPL